MPRCVGMEACVKGSEMVFGKPIRVYHQQNRAFRHEYAVVFMGRKFDDDGQYEALLMDHRPLDPREGFCVWGQRREAYQHGKRIRFLQLPRQCRVVVLKMLMKDEQMWHGFLDQAENLKLDDATWEHLLFDSPLPLDLPPLLKSADDLLLVSKSGGFKALKDAHVVVHGVLAPPGLAEMKRPTHDVDWRVSAPRGFVSPSAAKEKIR